MLFILIFQIFIFIFAQMFPAQFYLWSEHNSAGKIPDNDRNTSRYLFLAIT